MSHALTPPSRRLKFSSMVAYFCDLINQKPHPPMLLCLFSSSCIKIFASSLLKFLSLLIIPTVCDTIAFEKQQFSAVALFPSRETSISTERAVLPTPPSTAFAIMVYLRRRMHPSSSARKSLTGYSRRRRKNAFPDSFSNQQIRKGTLQNAVSLPSNSITTI